MSDHMAKARNGNRKCPNCKHFYAAHGYEPNTDRRRCVVPTCLCNSLQKEEEHGRSSDRPA